MCPYLLYFLLYLIYYFTYVINTSPAALKVLLAAEIVVVVDAPESSDT